MLMLLSLWLLRGVVGIAGVAEPLLVSRVLLIARRPVVAQLAAEGA